MLIPTITPPPPIPTDDEIIEEQIITPEPLKKESIPDSDEQDEIYDA